VCARYAPSGSSYHPNIGYPSPPTCCIGCRCRRAAGAMQPDNAGHSCLPIHVVVFCMLAQSASCCMPLCHQQPHHQLPHYHTCHAACRSLALARSMLRSLAAGLAPTASLVCILYTIHAWLRPRWSDPSNTVVNLIHQLGIALDISLSRR
jgi:hypothetical protein